VEVVGVRRSELTLFTSRETTSHDHETVSLLVRAGLIRQFGSGLYGFTPTGERVRERLIDRVETEMAAIGGRKISLPQLSHSRIWRESGRWESFEGEMFTFENRDGTRMCLAPSHEEGIVHLVDGVVRSYEDLPALYYQVGSKHRDDHARNGLLRTKEFTMKDAYSLHATEESLAACYDRVRAAYARLFESLGVEFVVAPAANDLMGGSASEEFVAPVDRGTLDLISCPADGCRFGVTDESPGEEYAGGDSCPECGDTLAEGEGIEVGHVFQLGTRYTEAMDLTVDAADGSERSVLMGSYGIGIERLLQTIAQQHADGAGCRWPAGVAPYTASIVPLAYDGAIRDAADHLHEECGRQETLLFDDPGQTIGERFAESDLLGIPRKIVLGNQFRETGRVELESRDGETTYARLEAVSEIL